MLVINDKRCNGCAHFTQPKCVDICPGDVLYLNEKEKASCYDSTDCWDCFACVKECPRNALSIRLPFQIDESRACLLVYHKGANTIFEMLDEDGNLKSRFIIPSMHI